jgi:hypothetical protein
VRLAVKKIQMPTRPSRKIETCAWPSGRLRLGARKRLRRAKPRSGKLGCHVENAPLPNTSPIISALTTRLKLHFGLGCIRILVEGGEIAVSLEDVGLQPRAESSCRSRTVVCKYCTCLHTFTDAWGTLESPHVGMYCVGSQL